jgi:hypothetical protein
MKIFNWTLGNNTPSQLKLGRSANMIGSFFGLGYYVEEYDLYSQVKDYRADLLNGTNWRPIDESNMLSMSYLQFLNLLSKYSTAIFNDFCKVGFTVFAKIDNKVFYVSTNNYTKRDDVVKVNGYPSAVVSIFHEPNAFCGEKTIFQKCEPFQKLYNITLSCQKNGMSKSGYVNVISPKTPSSANAVESFTDNQIEALEKRLSQSHGIASSEQTNMMILNREVSITTINYDFAKLGILETKKLCEEFVCSKLGVPYVLLPSSGQTFANYEQATDILMANHSRYCEFFTKFAKTELGFDIDYKTIEKTETAVTQV